MTRAEAVARAEELAERLSLPASVRPMFGGAAVMVDGAMVAFVSGGTVYLRVDEGTKVAFERRGAAPFTYERAGRPTTMKHYYAAPDDILDDDAALHAVATAALAAARAAHAPKRRSAASPPIRHALAAGAASRARTRPKAG